MREVRPLPRRGQAHEDSVVESELKRWGLWCGLQYAAEGYAPSSTIAQILSGRADRPGHRVLCIDPPEHFWEKNRRVLMLRRELYEVLVARYCVPLKRDGQLYRVSELAGFLGIAPETYLFRIAQAKRGYKRLLFPDLALSGVAC